MVERTTNVRVRYGETDQMGHLYYGFYAWYYEVGRVELLRDLGVSYKEIEENGVLMVVAQLTSKYLKPAKYDELITVKTIIPNMPSHGLLNFQTELYNETNQLLNKGEVKLICVDSETRKKVAIPLKITSLLTSYFE